MRVTLAHFLGSPLEGERAATRATDAAAPEADPSGALQLKARVLLLTGALPPGFAPIGPRSSLLAATSGRRPFLPASPLSREARLAPIAEGGAWAWNPWESPVRRHAEPEAAWVEAGCFRSTLPRDVTASVEIAASEDFLAGTEAGVLAMRVQVRRSAAEPPAAESAAESVQTALILQVRGFPEAPLDDPDPPREAAAAGEAGVLAGRARTARGYDREVFVIEDRAERPGGGWVIAAPLCGRGFASGMWGLVAFSLEPAPPANDPARSFHDEALARVLAEVSAAGSARDPSAESAAAAILGAVEGLGVPARQRKALAFLAEATGAAIAADVAVTGTEALVARLAALVAGAAPASREPAAMGWLLEKTAVEILAEMLAEKTLPAELEAVLARHAGEAGRSAAPLAGLLKNAAGRDDLIAGFARENLIALEDASPATRVRACDWLAARGKAPAGYDPLAAAKERRAALEKAMESGDSSASRQP